MAVAVEHTAQARTTNPPPMQPPAEAPAFPQAPTIAQGGGIGPVEVRIGPGVSGPAAVYRAFNAQREELADQMETLEDKRQDLQGQLQDPTVIGPSRTGIELRITELDKRIADMDRQIAAADQAVAQAAAVPGAVVPDPPRTRDGPPEEVFVLAGMFIVVVLLPISIALARRIWRRGAQVVTSVFPQELTERLNRLDQSVDSIAIEVERIGEGQRFVTRVMTDANSGRALGMGAAVPIDVASREKSRVSREGGSL